jgi:TonB family protein
VQQPPEPDPEPPKEIAKPAPKPSAESLEPSLEPKRKKIEINTTQITRRRDGKAEAKARAEAQAREQARAERAARQRMAQQIGAMASHISGEVSGSTSLELKGPGGGGLPYANFNQAVMSAYQRVWRQQEVEADEVTTVQTTATIGRDGTVISARITRPSDNASVNRAVQTTLDRVKYAAPLPDDAKEDQRTVPITFYAKPKRSIG